jgi:hypothetical protein
VGNKAGGPGVGQEELVLVTGVDAQLVLPEIGDLVSANPEVAARLKKAALDSRRSLPRPGGQRER